MVTTSGTQVGDTWTCYAAGTDQDDGTLNPTYEWHGCQWNTIGASGDTLVLSSSNSAPNAGFDLCGNIDRLLECRCNQQVLVKRSPTPFTSI